MESTKRHPSSQEMLAFSRGQFSVEKVTLTSRFIVTFDFVAQCFKYSRHSYNHRYAVLFYSINDLRRIQRVLKEYFAAEQLRYEYPHELTEYVTQRDQVEKSQRVNEAFVLEIFPNLGFERIDVRKNILMSKADAFGLGR